jgi:hypothetical protein
MASRLLGRLFYYLSHSTSIFFVLGIFETGPQELFAQGWIRTIILLISASSGAGLQVQATGTPLL